MCEYVAVDNPTAARALVRRIQGRLRDLAVFPRQGRPAGADRREPVIADTPYVAIYRIAGDEVQILRVLDDRQRRSRPSCRASALVRRSGTAQLTGAAPRAIA